MDNQIKGNENKEVTNRKQGRGGRKQYLFLAIAGVPHGEGSEVS